MAGFPAAHFKKLESPFANELWRIVSVEPTRICTKAEALIYDCL